MTYIVAGQWLISTIVVLIAKFGNITAFYVHMISALVFQAAFYGLIEESAAFRTLLVALITYTFVSITGMYVLLGRAHVPPIGIPHALSPSPRQQVLWCR